MAGAKLSPRQKMINMMYLVLMALLALNVSAEILKSFYHMEVSFISASKNIDEKNATTMKGFEKKLEENEIKTRPFYERAKKAEQITSQFISYIDSTQAVIEELYGGRKEAEAGQVGLTELASPDQMEKHARYFVKVHQGKNGKEFQEKVNQTRERLLALLKPDPSDTNLTIEDMTLYEQAERACQLRAEDEDKKGKVNQKGWIQENLEHNPAAGLMALFARIRNDAKTLESDILTKLATQIDAADYKFDRLEAKVLAKSSAVMAGGNYEADILLVASNSKGQPVIKVNGNSVPIENGVGKYVAGTGSLGTQSFAGSIVVSGPSGVDSFPFEAEYEVFKPAATIAADQMNLLYEGLNNPMSISVPGFTNINVSTSAGISLTKTGNGKYNAKVTGREREVTISVSVSKDGSSKSVGSGKFRVRPLPTPYAQIGTIPNDGLPKAKNLITLQGRINATMGPAFAYPLVYAVTQYQFIYAPARGEARRIPGTGPMLSAEMKSMISRARPGDRIIIEGIKARERTYGFTPNLSPIVVTIR